MIVLTMELHSAITKRTSHLGTIRICNDGAGTQRRGNYTAEFIHRDGKKGKKVRVEGHRRVALPVWTLVAKVLKEGGY